MTTRITKRDHFNALRTLAVEAGNDQLVAFVDHELELLDKKNTSGEKKPSAKQVENDAMRQAILAVMVPNTYYSLTQLSEMVPELNGAAPQKMSGLMRPLTNVPEAGITDRPVNKVVEKRKALFILA